MRRCPFCGVEVHPDHFACPAHWGGMTEEGRGRIYRNKIAYKAGHLSLEKFRDIQQEVLDAEGGAVLDARGNELPKPGREPPTKREVNLAKLIHRYVRLRKAYSAVREQMVDDKRKAGRVLQQCEAELVAAADQILCPEQTQLKLFDNPPADGTAPH